MVDTTTKGNELKRHSSGENRRVGEWFAANKGTSQGDPTSPNTFILVLERILDNIRDKEGGVKIGGTRINNLTFADDIDPIGEDA